MGDVARTKKFKGKYSAAALKKKKEDSKNDSMDSPFLYVADNADFRIDKANLLNNPSILIMDGYEDLDIDGLDFNVEKLNDKSEIKVVLRYFEYLCIATFNFKYIKPLLMSGLKGKDIFETVKHHLKMTLILNVPSVDDIYELELIYSGKIKY